MIMTPKHVLDIDPYAIRVGATVLRDPGNPFGETYRIMDDRDVLIAQFNNRPVVCSEVDPKDVEDLEAMILEWFDLRADKVEFRTWDTAGMHCWVSFKELRWEMRLKLTQSFDFAVANPNPCDVYHEWEGGNSDRDGKKELICPMPGYNYNIESKERRGRIGDLVLGLADKYGLEV